MKRCIIHIGMHKTGSTSIQYSLDGFQDDRFLYASLDIPNHSLAMHSLFSPRPERHHTHIAGGLDAAALSAYIAAMRKELDKSVAAAGKRTLLISGEDISVLPVEGLTRLRDHFRARFDELTIVGYVRPPNGLMASAFQQRTKSGAVVRVNLDREYRGYEKRFARFDTVFGRNNVQLWKFDPATFAGGCAVRNFCARLGISLPDRQIVRLNESMSRQVVSLLFTYGKFAPKFGFEPMPAPEGQKLGKLLAGAGNDKFRFSPEAVRPILEKNRADIEWMEARLGQSLDEGLGNHRPGDIRSESDLLSPDPEAVRRLLKLLGRAATKGIRGETPEEVARLVHAFRLKHKADKATASKVSKVGAKIRTIFRLRG